MSERPKLSAHRRYAVLQRDGFTCRYCGAHAPDVELEVDHVKAVALGGRNEYANLVTACKQCNRGKGARPFVDSADLADQVVTLKWQLKNSRGAACRLGKDLAQAYRDLRRANHIIELLMERLGAPNHDKPELDWIMRLPREPWFGRLPDHLQQRLDERDAA